MVWTTLQQVLFVQNLKEWKMLISVAGNFIHLLILPCLASSLASPAGAKLSAGHWWEQHWGHGHSWEKPSSSVAPWAWHSSSVLEVTLTVCLCSVEQEIKFQTEHRTSRLHLYKLHQRYLDVYLDISYYFVYPRDSFLLKYQSSLSLQ